MNHFTELDQEIGTVVEQCPTGALSLEEKEID